MEAVQIVGSVIKNFAVALDSPTNVTEVTDITLGAKDSLFLKLSKWDTDGPDVL